jgi:hypothetical protein
MIRAVDELDLAAVGAQVEIPEPVAASGEPAEPGALLPPRDRLAELATWWTSVTGAVRPGNATAPKRVEQLWLPRAAGPAPSRAEITLRPFDAPDDVPGALAWGIATADDAADDGADLVLLSAGPASTASTDGGRLDWQVLAALLLGLDAVEARGWPSALGMSDIAWVTQVAAVRDGLRRVRGLGEEPERLLGRLGSRILAAGTGLVLRAAARRTPVLLDGPAAAACALLAYRIARPSRHWLQAADGSLSAESPLHDRIMRELQLAPLTRFGLAGEDGTAARIGLGLLETAVERATGSLD